MGGDRWFRGSTFVALALCWITIILGGNVIANGAGLGCSSWPLCQPGDGLFPPLTGAMGIEWTHRVSAFFLAVAILLVTILALAYERRRPAIVRLSIAALALVVVLALLGGAVVDSDLDIGLVLIHFAVATILFGVLLILAFLANWPYVPPRWKRWAERTAEAAPASPPGEPSAAGPTPPGRAAAPSGPRAGRS